MQSGFYRQDRNELSSMFHGSAFRKHWMSAPKQRAPGERRVVLVAVGFGYDDLELLNALGAARGDKKV